MLFIARGSRRIAMSQMDKEFKLHAALAIEQRQVLCFDIDADFFHDFTLRGMRRRLILFQLPVTDCQNSVSSRRCNISTRPLDFA